MTYPKPQGYPAPNYGNYTNSYSGNSYSRYNQYKSKPGVKTTEFWLTLAMQIAGILGFIGIFSQDLTENNEITNAVIKCLEGLGILIANGVVLRKYIGSRVDIKSMFAGSTEQEVENINLVNPELIKSIKDEVRQAIKEELQSVTVKPKTRRKTNGDNS